MFYAPDSPNVTDTAAAPYRVLRRVLHWLLPSPCLGCREPVLEIRGSLGLCPPCRQRLRRWPAHGCAVCGALAAGAGPAGRICRACRERSRPYDRVLSTWCYLPPLDEVVAGLKFRRLDYLAEHLGRSMAEFHRTEAERCDVVVPVPLYWARSLRRGYNQAALLARALSRETGLPFAEPLVRRRATRHQSRLGRADRQHNLERAFAPRRRARVGDCRVLLVDDVTTTGATLTAAAACLKRAGARSVVALTAGRTPTDSERSLLEAPQRCRSVV